MKRLAVALVLAAATAGCGGGSGGLQVTQSSLSPGEITLVVENTSDETEQLAQVIVNDAFVDFRASNRMVPPRDIEALVISYPWISGESYEIRVLTSAGRTVDYEIEDAA